MQRNIWHTGEERTCRQYARSVAVFLCRRRHRFWHVTQDCIIIVPYVDHILHRDRFWAISIASGSVRLWVLRSCCMVLSHMMQRRPQGSSSPLEGELTGSSWHLCYRPYEQCAQKGSGDVTGLLQWVASGPRRFEQIGAIWYLAAFVVTTDQKHRSSVHLSLRLPSNRTHIGPI